MFQDFFCKEVAEQGLVRASSGNYSHRSTLNEKNMFITATGLWFNHARKEDIIECDIKSRKPLNKDEHPSSEIEFHARIYEVRNDVRVVLHCQPIHSTIIACFYSNFENINFNVIPEIPCYIKHIGHIDYIKPGTLELAEAIENEIKNNDLIIMRNHGLVVVGKNHWEVLQRAIFFELACEIIVKSKSIILSHINETN